MGVDGEERGTSAVHATHNQRRANMTLPFSASVSVAMSAGLRAGSRPSRGVSRADARHAASLAQHQREIRRVTADAHDAAS